MTRASRSFPLKLGKSRRRVANIILRKQRPAITFGGASRFDGLRHRHAAADRRAQFVDQTIQVAPFVGHAVRPIRDKRAMAGDDALRGNGAETIEILEPAEDTTVNHRYVTDEQEVTGKQCRTCDIQHRQIVVAVRRGPGLEYQAAVSKIEVEG